MRKHSVNPLVVLPIFWKAYYLMVPKKSSCFPVSPSIHSWSLNKYFHFFFSKHDQHKLWYQFFHNDSYGQFFLRKIFRGNLSKAVSVSELLHLDFLVNFSSEDIGFKGKVTRKLAKFCEFFNGQILSKILIYMYLTHFSPVLLFYSPWKHQKTFKFSDVFRRYRKAVPGCNGLKLSI